MLTSSIPSPYICRLSLPFIAQYVILFLMWFFHIYDQPIVYIFNQFFIGHRRLFTVFESLGKAVSGEWATQKHHDTGIQIWVVFSIYFAADKRAGDLQNTWRRQKFVAASQWLFNSSRKLDKSAVKYRSTATTAIDQNSDERHDLVHSSSHSGPSLLAYQRLLLLLVDDGRRNSWESCQWRCCISCQRNSPTSGVPWIGYWSSRNAVYESLEAEILL